MPSANMPQRNYIKAKAKVSRSSKRIVLGIDLEGYKLNGFVYHDNWLNNMLISTSIAGAR